MTRSSATGSYADLVDDASTVAVAGWDFSRLDGRATEGRPPWGYQRQLSARLATSSAGLDVQTGGAEVLAGVPTLPPPAYRS